MCWNRAGRYKVWTIELLNSIVLKSCWPNPLIYNCKLHVSSKVHLFSTYYTQEEKKIIRLFHVEHILLKYNDIPDCVHASGDVPPRPLRDVCRKIVLSGRVCWRVQKWRSTLTSETYTRGVRGAVHGAALKPNVNSWKIVSKIVAGIVRNDYLCSWNSTIAFAEIDSFRFVYFHDLVSSSWF